MPDLRWLRRDGEPALGACLIPADLRYEPRVCVTGQRMRLFKQFRRVRAVSLGPEGQSVAAARITGRRLPAGC